jgi:hypothetical protein
VELSEELQACLREFSAAGPAELRENGSRVAPLASLAWEVRGDSTKPLLHLWSENHNLTRRVLAITEHSEERLSLAVERYGRAKPERLEFHRIEYERSPRELSREAYCQRLGSLLAEKFPDETVESLSVSADLEHSLSGNYVRGVLRRGSNCIVLLALPDANAQDPPARALTFALLWLERVRHTSRGTSAGKLRLILPKGMAAVVAQILPALDERLAIELYELDPVREILEPVDPHALTNFDSWLVPQRETQALLDRAHAELRPILSRASRAVTLHASVPSREVWLRFRGLPFLRWEEGKMWFGMPEPRSELTPASEPAFKRILHELELHRSPLASDNHHPLYRAHPERWLEALVREDISRIDAALDQRFVYAQVFANTAAEHGILDLVGVTRSGRLAVIELKASEHIHLPLQAANYWLRIRRHLDQGDFQRYGYFPAMQLQAKAPLVYLVAPALRFHPTTDVLLRYFTPDLEILRVGLAESWRRGVRVVLRQ